MINERLRHNEYYDLQNIFDKLYKKSLEKENFKNLIKIISSKDNILLAYRNIKRNTGSGTAGVDGLTIKDIEIITIDEVVETVRYMIKNYNPKPVRRVYQKAKWWQKTTWNTRNMGKVNATSNTTSSRTDMRSKIS